jgi:hypothetical protein
MTDAEEAVTAEAAGAAAEPAAKPAAAEPAAAAASNLTMPYPKEAQEYLWFNNI